ncbi:ArsR/SmtB family transcription factor [Paenibacillus xanthanilyticus]|uniref:ArsR/SmtB family transcription factor n=1 Tax=Paenibacillus xanthanilyticus TaxID=1783531 RepID=A0ABV8K7Y5_9BACL
MSHPLSINLEQQKLLASALRVKLLHALKDTPRTVKQISVLLEETPGNVHYHLKRLLEGKLVEIVETRELGGIVEKYYKSVATVFHSRSHPRPGVETRLLLSAEEALQLKQEFAELLGKWEERTALRKREPDHRELLINVDIVPAEEGH